MEMLHVNNNTHASRSPPRARKRQRTSKAQKERQELDLLTDILCGFRQNSQADGGHYNSYVRTTRSDLPPRYQPDVSPTRTRTNSVGTSNTSNPRARRRTTPSQLLDLQQLYDINPRPSAHQRATLAKQIGMTPRRVQVWFQNRRSKKVTPTNKKISLNTTSVEPARNFQSLPDDSGVYPLPDMEHFATVSASSSRPPSPSHSLASSPLNSSTPSEEQIDPNHHHHHQQLVHQQQMLQQQQDYHQQNHCQQQQQFIPVSFSRPPPTMTVYPIQQQQQQHQQQQQQHYASVVPQPTELAECNTSAMVAQDPLSDLLAMPVSSQRDQAADGGVRWVMTAGFRTAGQSGHQIAV
eukprot:TRINITY_DN1009_c0_g1_i1.p1 TRINITY_DN1009_c0_g1~~TRINITY_DN1009_c0_g1_i1.p1  ORF type:complete len:351 (+),score=67.42 TRINITY_DN1009_c0_g1_i1:139-1191(+)